VKKEVVRTRETAKIPLGNLGFIAGPFAGHHSKHTGWLAGPSIIWMGVGSRHHIFFLSLLADLSSNVSCCSEALTEVTYPGHATV